MKKLFAGVIGCGNISRFHFSGLEKAGVKIAWVCDLNEAAARPWADKFGARYTADYRELIADPAVNLVDVTALSRIHTDVCLAAIAAEKRRAATAPTCEVFVVVADEAQRANALQIVQAARDLGWRTDFSLKPAKVGRQFQDAEGMGARHAVVVGAEWPSVKIKTLATRQEIAADQSELASRLGKPGVR